jgi:hypothetical protein
MEMFDLKKQYRVEIPNRFAGLENLNAEVVIYRSRNTVRENI